MKQKFISEKNLLKKGIEVDHFFCLYEKRIAEGDSKSILYTLYSILYTLLSSLFFVLYSLCFDLFLNRCAVLKQINEINHRLRRLLHILYRNPFLFAVEGMFPCEDVRAR